MLSDNLEGWEVGWRFKREGTYVYLWLIYVDVWQKPTQYCKEIIRQLKINKLRKKENVIARFLCNRGIRDKAGWEADSYTVHMYETGSLSSNLSSATFCCVIRSKSIRPVAPVSSSVK